MNYTYMAIGYKQSGKLSVFAYTIFLVWLWIHSRICYMDPPVLCNEC